MPYARPNSSRHAPTGMLGQIPVSTLRPYRGPKDTLDLMVKNALGQFGERSMIVRRFTEFVVGQVQSKCYLSEILAIRGVFAQMSPTVPGTPLVKYVNDPRHIEFLRTPERMVKDINEHGFVVADCDEYACLAGTMLLQIGRAVRYAAMGFAPRSLSHVAVCGKEPKSGQWILLDGVAGPREREAANKAVELMFRVVD